MKSHLSEEEIEAFLCDGSAGEAANPASPIATDARGAHLAGCAQCKSKLDAARELHINLSMLRSEGLRTEAFAQAAPDCPEENEWIALAAGVPPEGDAGRLMEHASRCDRCATLLRDAAEDVLGSLTPEQEQQLAELGSRTERWRQALAGQLLEARLKQRSPDGDTWIGTSPAGAVVPRPGRRRWSWLRPTGAMGMAGLIVAMVLSACSWWLLHRARIDAADRLADKLIAQAYTEKRTLPMRIGGVASSPLRQERGPAQSRMERPALLKAEAEIAARLAADPDNVEWLQAKGRASLLENDPETAVSVLESAHSKQRDNESVAVDLASAYLLRAQIGGDGRDAGQAVEMLAAILLADPGEEVAQFNDALALEEIGSKAEAAAAWRRFLLAHPRSDWAPEAQQRLARVEEQIHGQSLKRGESLRPAAAVAAALQAGDQAAIAEIDARIEEYSDTAAREWLPAFAGSAPGSAAQVEFDAALRGVATLLSDRHGDRWLADTLAAPALHSVKAGEALHAMAGGERDIEASDDSRAREELGRAIPFFDAAGMGAEAIRAGYDLAFIDQLEGRRDACETRAEGLSRTAAIERYAWLRAESRLEEAACLDDSDVRAAEKAAEAERIAVQNGLPLAGLRALSFESAIAGARGDERQAWELAEAGLSRYWAGAFPPVRGYNFLFNLQQLAERRQESLLEAALLREASAMIAAHPNNAMRAFEQEELGHALLRGGDVAGAEQAFHQAASLFEGMPPGGRRDELAVEGEIGLASAESQGGRYRDAVARLNHIRNAVGQTSDRDLRRSFFATAGIAELRAGLADQSRPDLESALKQIGEERDRAQTELDRLRWSRENEAAVRAMVELELRTDPVRAFEMWEQFKGQWAKPAGGAPWKANEFSGARLARAAASAPSSQSGDPNAHPTLISYGVFSDSIAIWIWNDKGLRQISIAVPHAQLEAAARSFAQACSDPASDRQTLAGEARALYRMLIAPIEPWLRDGEPVIVEPDGVLRVLPMEALMDARGRYLGERFDVAISPGLYYLEHARSWKGIGPDTEALIVGAPKIAGWAALPDAEEEARAVAAQFSHAHLHVGEPLTDTRMASQIGRAEVLHIAGHGTASGRSAGILMSDSNVLNAWPRFGAGASRSRLVVLSACATSRGTGGYFDDDDSLVRQIVSAGVPNVVASRWMVDSAATRVLMTDFYKGLLEGQTVSASIAGARRSLRRRPGYEHPYYWAGFSVFGRG